jgi:hypothetical protein
LAGSFLDTTVVIHIASDLPDAGSKAQGYIDKNHPAETPYYAFQELLAGYIRSICEAHNILSSATNPGEALLALLARNPIEGRKKITRIQEVASVLASIYATNPTRLP